MDGDLRVRVLGEFEIEGLSPYHVGSRKARTLLKVLALARGRAVSVEQLSDCLWSAGAPSRPADQVTVLVSRLRGVLGADRLPRSDAGYGLRVDWLDLDALAELTAQASACLAASDPIRARSCAAAALELIRGPLLPDEQDAPWAETDRALVSRLAADARCIGAEAALELHEPAAAREFAAAAFAEDAYDEAAFRLLMRAEVAAGRPAAALAAYERLRERLADDLGVDPAAETQALHAAILRGESLSGPPSARPPPSERATAKRSPTSGRFPDPPPPAAIAGDLPGRAQPLTELDAALAGAAEGVLQLVAVEGEAGIGKTRLLQVWAARARGAGATVLIGSGDELGRSLPLQAVIDALDAHLQAVGPAGAAALLGADAAALSPLLHRVETPGAAWPLLVGDAEAARALLFSALLRLIGRIAAQRPLVLLIDDVHLAGQSTLDWLTFVARRGGTLRLVVVTSRRPDEGRPAPATTKIRLEPLGLEAVAAVVGPARAPALLARSGGHPLFLVELADADPGEALPASIREAVEARCERAGSAASTLHAAALIGSPIDIDLLAAMLGRPPVELLEHLEEGERRGLLDERGGAFRFRHALIREALEAGTGAARRALLHREAARALSGYPGADPLTVARHAQLGGDPALAAAALTEGARVASNRHDHAEAERLLDQAVRLHDSPEARLARGVARLCQRRYVEAEEDALAALRLGAVTPALELAGWAAYYRRDFLAARRYADDGARLADDPELRASCLVVAGRVRHTTGELATAEERLTQAITLASGQQLAHASAFLGQLRMHQGRAAEALDLVGSARRMRSQRGYALTVVHAHMTAAHAFGMLGRVAEALDALDAMEKKARQEGIDHFNGRADNYRGWILRQLGGGAEADEHNHRALEEARRLGLTEAVGQAVLDLADAALRDDDHPRAARWLDELPGIWTQPVSNVWRQELRARLLRARLARAAGNAGAALEVARQLQADASRLGVDRYVALVGLEATLAAAALGDRIAITEVDAVVATLDEVAGLEGWWLTAELAAATGVDSWWQLAEQRVARLAATAGERGTAFARYAGTRLERMRTARHSG